jgi:hypothetical protein
VEESESCCRILGPSEISCKEFISLKPEDMSEEQKKEITTDISPDTLIPVNPNYAGLDLQPYLLDALLGSRRKMQRQCGVVRI